MKNNIWISEEEKGIGMTYFWYKSNDKISFLLLVYHIQFSHLTKQLLHCAILRGSIPIFVINLHTVTLKIFNRYLNFRLSGVFWKKKLWFLVSTIIYTVSCWFLGKMTYKIMGKESRISFFCLFLFAISRYQPTLCLHLSNQQFHLS